LTGLPRSGWFGPLSRNIAVNRAITFQEITAGYALAAVTLCVGIYLGLEAGGEMAGLLLTPGFSLLAAFIVLKYTFAWGKRRGLAVRREDGTVAVNHLVKNLLMAAAVWVVMGVAFGPLILFVTRLAR
jgi:hypothetical protein